MFINCHSVSVVEYSQVKLNSAIIKLYKREVVHNCENGISHTVINNIIVGIRIFSIVRY